MFDKSIAKKLLKSFIRFDDYMDSVFSVTSEPFAVSQYLQFFNNNARLNANFKKQNHSRISKDELLKVTQLFTPRHIADFLTHNSLKERLLSLSLTQASMLKILDPAAGTGNLLFSAYEILTDFYQNKQGLSKELSDSLIENNLIGFEIDPNVASVAKRVFNGININLNLLVFPKPSPKLCEFLNENGLFSLLDTYKGFEERGSLSIFDENEINRLSLLKIPKSLRQAVDQILALYNAIYAKYDIVLVNPPYLASSDYSFELDKFITKNYKPYRTDLFMAFIKRALAWLNQEGMLGVVCPYNWMFTIKYQNIRSEIINNHRIKNLAMLDPDSYKGATVFLSAFVLENQLKNGQGLYIKEEKTTQKSFLFNQKDFNENPNQAMIFWTSNRFRQNYKKGRLSDVLEIRQGLATADNKRFLRPLHEIDSQELCSDATSIADFIKSGKKYAPYNKGGRFRKWFGNNNFVIWFDAEAQRILSKQGNKMPSKDFYFKPCITWTLVSSKQHFGARYSQNSVFDVGGSCGFAKDERDIFVILGYLCSVVATYYLNAQNPTLNCQVGDIKNLPYIDPCGYKDQIEALVKENIEIAKKDWESVLEDAEFKRSFAKLKENETALNKIFIEIYGLHELDCNVPDKLITLKNNRRDL